MSPATATGRLFVGSTLDDLPLTDAGTAERFARRHGHEARFDHARRRWLLWTGHRWQPDAEGAIVPMALAFARDWQREAVEIPDRERKEATVKAALKLERREALNGLLALAANLPPMADAGLLWDAEPWLLGVPNGVVSLRDGRFRPGLPGDRITRHTSVPYDPLAPCPRWERFLQEVLDGDQDLVAFVHRAVGYSLTAETWEQCLFLLYGVGANGKGVFVNTLRAVCGDYGHVTPFSTLEAHERSGIPNDVAALAGRRLVVASETNDGTRLNEARVKALTGCDPLSARYLHAEWFEFTPVAKFWLAVNHKPVIRDDSHGFWRRVRLVPFRRTFPPNPELPRALADESHGILAWAVRGCLAWLEAGGLNPPAIVTEATDTYRADSDPLADFLHEACLEDPVAEVRGSDLYAHYREWADWRKLTERERLTATGLGRKCGERFERVRRRHGVAYRGLATRNFRDLEAEP